MFCSDKHKLINMNDSSKVKSSRNISVSNIVVIIVSVVLCLWMITIVVQFDMHTRNICRNIDQIYLAIQKEPVDDSKILEFHNSKIGTGGLVVAFISVIVTFLAFYIQYVFNRQQKKDISSERTENQLFHLMDVYRDICLNSIIDENINGKRAFHYMFYEYKAIFNLINDYIADTELEMNINDKNYLAFVFFLNGLTPNALPTYNNPSLDNESKVQLLTAIRDLLYNSRKQKSIIYLLDYNEKNITFADGHRHIIIPYTKYINLIIDFIVTQAPNNATRRKYLRFLSSEMTEHEIGLLYAFNAYMANIEEGNKGANSSSLKDGYDFIYNDLPADMGYKFKYDNKEFFNRQKISIN